MSLVQEIRNFLANEKIDYLLVNSTNEFLSEYSDLNENSRYFLTNFSGSTGDALISQKDLFLFVDGRYHEQADLEVDKSLVTVVKMELGETLTGCLTEKIKPKKKLAIVAKKNSQGRFEILNGVLHKNNIETELLDFDPVMMFLDSKPKDKLRKIEQISLELSGLSADDKFNLVANKLNNNEAILTTNLEEVSYFCNLRDFSVNYSSQIQAKCLIAKTYAVLFTDSKIEIFSDKFKILPLKEFENYVANSDIEFFLVDKNTTNAHDFALLAGKAKFSTDNHIKKMKSIKNKAEIAHYKASFERTDKALLATREFIEQGENLSEYDITKNLEENFYKFGAKSLSFKSIVAKDKNAALAHYSDCSKSEIMTDGSLVLIDCGAYYEGGYATDCTRVFIKGQPSTLQKKVYTVVLKGFLAAFNKKITEKTSGYALDKTARNILNEHAPKGFTFSHALGHGIGINVHEAPPNLGLSPAAKIPLEPNMCFTIEPGLYNAKVGGVRLENSCYLEKSEKKLAIKSFSNMPFERKLIDSNLLTERETEWLKAFEVV